MNWKYQDFYREKCKILVNGHFADDATNSVLQQHMPSEWIENGRIKKKKEIVATGEKQIDIKKNLIVIKCKSN